VVGVAVAPQTRAPGCGCISGMKSWSTDVRHLAPDDEPGATPVLLASAIRRFLTLTS
jgi:hypothetical protein